MISVLMQNYLPTIQFTIVYDENIAAEQLNNDLKILSEWAYQCNPDKTKHAAQVIFSQKRTEPIYPPSYFNENQAIIKQEQKHLGFILDSGLTFHSHVREKIISARRGIGVIRFLSKYVSMDVLEQMYKLYVRLHLDYEDIIYHKFDPEFALEFTRKLESIYFL